VRRRRPAQLRQVQPGQRFGRLTVTSPLARRRFPSGRSVRAAVVTCDCGQVRTVPLYDLASGNTRSCGCLARETAAGLPYDGRGRFGAAPAAGAHEGGRGGIQVR
jgi:hypothetical protein